VIGLGHQVSSASGTAGRAVGSRRNTVSNATSACSRADAQVRPGPERDVPPVAPALPGPERVRVGERRRIAVGREYGDQDRVAGVHDPAADFDVLGGKAPGRVLQRGVQPQRLLDDGGAVRRIAPGPGGLVRVGQEREGAGRDQPDGRLVAADEDQERRRRHLVRGERARGLLGDQIADEVRVRRGAFGVDDLGDQLFQNVGGFADLLAADVVRGVDDQRPLVHGFAVALGHAQQVADDRDRERIGELGDKVAAPAGLDGGDQVVGHLLGAFAQVCHPAGTERAGAGATQAGVLGRVDVDHVRRECRPVVQRQPELGAPPLDVARERALEQAGVVERGEGVVVPGDQPGPDAAGELEPVRWPFAQPGVSR